MAEGDIAMTEQTAQTQTLEAVYENGMFRPLQPVGQQIKEGEKVRLQVHTVSAALHAIEELMHIFDGLTEEEIREIEKAVVRRSGESGPRMAIATSNKEHFSRISGLQVENWLRG